MIFFLFMKMESSQYGSPQNGTRNTKVMNIVWQHLVVYNQRLGRYMIPDTHNSHILLWVSTAFVRMQENMMIGILWWLRTARGKVICCCTMMFDTHRHVWASLVQIMAVVDTDGSQVCLNEKWLYQWHLLTLWPGNNMPRIYQ